MESTKCSKIRCIVRLRQMLRRWRNKARMSSSSPSSSPAAGVPSDVPPGHVAVHVGRDFPRRYIVKATYLNHPFFKKLLNQVEEEYGFSNTGPLLIPCAENTFLEILRFISRSESGKPARFDENSRRNCHEGFRNNNNNLEIWPLLRGFTSAQ